MMLPRHYLQSFQQKLRSFPIVTVLGPRQCGKTTFIKASLPHWTYLDLEKPSDYVPLEEDPEARLTKLGPRVILDEAQQLPKLFPLLRSVVDAKRNKNGQYVLLGSASPNLISQISESLTGRTAFLEMAPFHWHEIYSSKRRHPLEVLWYRGGFPNAFLQSKESARLDWFESYTKTFIERDLNALGISVSSSQMRKLWMMLAHLNGSIWNASQLASSLGVSYHTINHYADILEQTFLIRKLQPYFINIGKRIVKSPKIYFRDTGLLHYFLGIHQQKLLDTHPSRGASWEGFLVEQICNAYHSISNSVRAYFWRTQIGAEVDLLIEFQGRLIPFEMKLHSSPSRREVRGLNICMKDLKLKKGYIVYPGQDYYSLGNGIQVLSAQKILSEPRALLAL